MPPMPTEFRWTVVVGIIFSVVIAGTTLDPLIHGWSLPWKLVVTFLVANIIFCLGRYALWRAGYITSDNDEEKS